MRPSSLRRAAGPVRVDELVRDNDAAIEARVQALAAAVAAESNAVQPDFALIDCLRQQIIDMRTIQDNMHHFLVGRLQSEEEHGGEGSSRGRRSSVPQSPADPATPAGRTTSFVPSFEGLSSGPGTPAHDGPSMLPDPTPLHRAAASNAAQLVQQGEYDASGPATPSWDLDPDKEWWGASQFTTGRPVRAVRPSTLVSDADAILTDFGAAHAAERGAYEASIQPPPQPIWRWTKFMARTTFYILAPVLYLIIHQRGGGRYTHWYELLSKALTPPLLLGGAVELVITPRVIRHVMSRQGWQPRTWGDRLGGMLPLWLQRRANATARQKKEDARASVALIRQDRVASDVYV